jgi:hypothetical protein
MVIELQMARTWPSEICVNLCSSYQGPVPGGLESDATRPPVPWRGRVRGGGRAQDLLLWSWSIWRSLTMINDEGIEDVILSSWESPDSQRRDAQCVLG